MIDFTEYKIKIDSAFSLGWKKNTAVARPRKFSALSFRLHGSATYTHDDKTYKVEKNDIVFIPAKYGYVISANKSEEVMVIHFYIEDKDFDDMSVFTPSNPDSFYRLFLEMIEVSRAKPIGYASKLLSLFYKISEQIEIQSYKNSLTKKPPILEQAVEYLHNNFSSHETSVESLAKHVNVSAVYLRRLFKSSFLKSPCAYLNELRLNYATVLIKTGYYTIEEVAYSSGFNDSKYFSSLYKKKYGVLPSKILNKAIR